jgi:hypothetical protein
VFAQSVNEKVPPISVVINGLNSPDEIISATQDDTVTVSPDFVVPGTKWVYLVKSVAGHTMQCEVTLSLRSGNLDHQVISFAFGSKGSLVILLIDDRITRIVRDYVGWAPGKVYNVVIIPDKDSTPFDAKGEPLSEELLLVHLPQDQRFLMEGIYRSKKLFITVGGVAHNTYDVTGLSKAIEQLQTCPINH